MPKEQQTEELQLATAEAPDISTLERIDAPAIWDGFRAELEKIKSTAETLTVTSVEQKREIALARDTRLALKKIRVAVEHKRKELVEGLKKKAGAIDGDAREIRVVIERLEARLEEQEEFAVRAEAERVEKLQSERSQRLLAVGGQPNFYLRLGEMPEEGFAQLIEGLEVADRLKKERAAEEAARVAAEKAAEGARIAKEKADAEERARIAAENEKLRKEAAEKEAALKAEREAAEKARKEAAEAARKEAIRIQAESAKEREKQEMAMQEIQGIQQQAMIAVVGRAGVRKGDALECLEDTLKETEEWPIGESFGPLQKAAQSAKETAIASIQQAIRAFNDRREAELAKKAQEAARLKAQAEHEALLKKNAAEKKAREEAEEAVRRAQQEAMDKQAAEAKARQDAAKAPDRDKLVAFAQSLRSLEFPQMSTAEGKAAVAKLIENTGKLADWTEKKAEEM